MEARSERTSERGVGESPDPEWVRGACPRCGQELVSASYYVAGQGYLVIWECWASRQADPNCDYRRVL